MERRWGRSSARITARLLALGLLLGVCAGTGAGCGDGIIGSDGRHAESGPDVVAAAGSITGLVRDGAGQAVPGAEVATEPATGVAVTDATGGYALAGVPAGTYTVRVTRAGFAPAVREGVAVAPAGTAVVDLTLVAEESAGRVVGTVVSAADDEPLGGAALTLTPGDATTTSDAAGRFVFEGVAAGSYTVSASLAGYAAATATTTVTAGEDAPVALTLAPEATVGVIEGTVASAADCTAPIGGALVATEPASVEALSGVDGRYRLEGVAPGTYAVRATAEGYETAAADATVTAGATSTTNLCLAALPTWRTTCEACHLQESALLADLAADPLPEPPGEAGSTGEGEGGSVPEVPVHQKVLVSPEFLSDAAHGGMACTDCHAGDPDGTTRAAAHVGLVSDPAGAAAACGSCHGDVVAAFRESFHATLGGMRHVIAQRAGGDTLDEPLATAFTNHCSKCHATCGACHLSVPASAGGGLLRGHMVRRTPPMTRTCTACHGSRVGDEYRGQNAGVAADVHYNRGMQCTDCHGGSEMHGEGSAGADHRYAVTDSPRCEDCHPDDAEFKQQTAHAMHRDDSGQPLVACQVCHALPYKHCYGCHVDLDNGAPVYEVNAPSHESILAFKIGRNPLRDELHPEAWVLLRHAPIAPTNFETYGAALLSAFDVLPTWRLATPHNIQRQTPQNAACANCHGQRALFLGPDDLEPYEVQANESVIVLEPPGP